MGEAEGLNRIAAYPELFAIGILFAGFVIARLLSIGLGYVLGALDRRMSRLATTETGLLTPHMIALSRAIVFWVTLIVAVLLALSVIGTGNTAAEFNSALISFVPAALIAFVIIVAGHLLGVLVSNLSAQLSDDLAPDSPGPKLLYSVIIGVAIVMALQHVGIDITFVTRLLLILVAVVGGGLMLAFAIGARCHVANLLAHRELSRIAVGEYIRIDEVQGKVVEIHNTAVDIATAEGIATIPAARFAEVNVLRLSEDPGEYRSDE